MRNLYIPHHAETRRVNGIAAEGASPSGNFSRPCRNRIKATRPSNCARARNLQSQLLEMGCYGLFLKATPGRAPQEQQHVDSSNPHVRVYPPHRDS